MKVVVTDAADRDLLEAFVYLRERNPAAAEAFANEINDKFGHLARFPFIGRERQSLGSNLRRRLRRLLFGRC